ncbi:MAG: SPOR domain-containing protein [Bacteroidota bacterium]|nr:SPOR domain-containing protein [Bacteroidota bacterium]MDP4192402.1 SPOR domain-containing protein [Bacteroidota bacterium]MDP4195154.1 SPOR domain-containing protein [Bacteroidota bacterium]
MNIFLREAILITFTVAFFTCSSSFAQDTNISPQLKLIESGQIDKAREELNRLKVKNSKDPSILYLEALLTSDAKSAISIYSTIAEKYPKSTYADAALYRSYSYYYSLGLYSTAKNIIAKLKKSYPKSPYIKLAEKKKDVEPFSEQINPSLENNSQAAEEVADDVTKNYTIQAGAFLNIENAKKLKESFQTDGYIAEIKAKEVAGSILNVVDVGAFATEDEAKSVLLLINDRYKLNGRVISLEK